MSTTSFISVEVTGRSAEASSGLEHIQTLIPHRGEFLFVESLQILSAQRYSGTARWQPTQAGLAGHFPGAPIVPAIFVVEAAAQIAGAGLIASRERQADSDSIGVLAAIRRCAFSRPVFPGQQVHFDLVVDKVTAAFVGVKGQASIHGQPSASLDFVLAWAPRSQVFEGRHDH